MRSCNRFKQGERGVASTPSSNLGDTMRSFARVTHTLFGLLMASVLAVAVAGTAEASVGGFYEIVNTGTQKCVDVPHGSTSPGVHVAEYDCHNADNQLWALGDLGNGYFQVVNRHSGLCFELPNESGLNGTPIEQAYCFGYLTEQWQLSAFPSFPQVTYHLINRLTGKCLELDNDSPNNGTPIQIWDCYDIPAQSWTFV